MIRLIRSFSLTAIFLLISACAIHNKPINNPPSPRDECKSLQQRMAFLNLNRTDQSQWQSQSAQLQMQRAYQAKGCYRTMDTTQPSKSKNVTIHRPNRNTENVQ